jgi:uncharacterized cupin superfamily protein
MERQMPPGGRMTPAHIHEGDEGFFILEGSITFIFDGEEHVQGPGTFVLVPEGTGHTFGNTSAEPARLLIMHAPAADAYFSELEQLWSNSTPPAVEEERALQARHGMRPA